MELGKRDKLKVKEFTEHGAILEDSDENIVLLPNKETENLKKDDLIDVFIYKDSEDRLIATKEEPLIHLNEFVPLKVKEVTKIGAFLDWGLEKDLLLPFSEQTIKVTEGEKYLVKLYVDKSDRLAASMKIYSDLDLNSPYKKGDWVKGTIYGINSELGALVAVDNKYNGMVLKDDFNESIKNGNKVKLRVVRVRNDGKLQLSPIKKAYKEIDSDALMIVKALKLNKGFIPFNDKSSPEAIRAEFDISKGAFKKALGFLLKKGFIKQTEDGIQVIEK